MMQRTHRRVVKLLTILLAAAPLLWSVALVHAEGETIEVKSSSVTSEFPNGFRIEVEASGDSEIKSIAIRVKIGQRTSGAYGYLCPAGSLEASSGLRCEGLEPARLVNGELFWRTDTGSRYIPPGTIITYNFEIEDSKGARLETEQQQFIYEDIRFEWHETSTGPVTVAYHGPVKRRAEIVLEAILETLDHMGPILGAGTEEPIRVTMYNNVKEMLEALPPKSPTISRELITEGQAFIEEGTLMMLGGGRLAKGTASHEVTHIIVHRAGDSVFRNVPPWLNEGLAEYGNIDPGFSYDIALDFAVATNRLLPIPYMAAMPGNPEDVIIFYGQARSIIQLIIQRFGVDKMAQLMASLKSGQSVDDALQDVYGLGIQGLDDLWRDSIGAPRFIPPRSGRALPTPVPQRAILPYSLTPQPGSVTIEAKSDAPTPTPKPEPAAPAPPTVAAPVEGETAPGTDIAPDSQTEKAAANGLGCGAPLQGSATALDPTIGAIIFGLVGLGLRRRIRR